MNLFLPGGSMGYLCFIDYEIQLQQKILNVISHVSFWTDKGLQARKHHILERPGGIHPGRTSPAVH